MHNKLYKSYASKGVVGMRRLSSSMMTSIKLRNCGEKCGSTSIFDLAVARSRLSYQHFRSETPISKINCCTMMNMWCKPYYVFKYGGWEGHFFDDPRWILIYRCRMVRVVKINRRPLSTTWWHTMVEPMLRLVQRTRPAAADGRPFGGQRRLSGGPNAAWATAAVSLSATVTTRVQCGDLYLTTLALLRIMVEP